jgi:hypothetical protein
MDRPESICSVAQKKTRGLGDLRCLSYTRVNSFKVLYRRTRLKGLSHEIDFKNFAKNLQKLA